MVELLSGLFLTVAAQANKARPKPKTNKKQKGGN